MLKVLFLVLFISISFAFAQEEDDPIPPSQGTQTHAPDKFDLAEDGTVEAPTNQPHSEADMNAKISDTLQELQNMDKNEQTAILDKLQANQKSMVDALIKDNPFSRMTRDEIKRVLVERSKGQRFEALFQKYPKTLDFAAEFLGDKDALAKFIGITAQPEKMKKYGIIMICLFIVSFWLNMKNKNGSLLARLGKKMLISSCMLVMSLMTFYYLFKDELSPSLIIFKKHFL